MTSRRETLAWIALLIYFIGFGLILGDIIGTIR
jgi:hypothetical protein